MLFSGQYGQLASSEEQGRCPTLHLSPHSGHHSDTSYRGQCAAELLLADSIRNDLLNSLDITGLQNLVIKTLHVLMVSHRLFISLQHIYILIVLVLQAV